MVKMNNKNNTASYSKNDSSDSSDTIIRFDRLSWKEIDSLNRSKTLFFLPISPLEEHGPHLPVGTDLITVYDTTIKAIKIIEKKYPSYSLVLFPALPIGFAGFNTDFPGTVSVSSRVVKNVVFQFGKMLATHGFQYLMICTYHMALVHLKGINAAMKKLQRKYKITVCEPWSPVFYSDMIKQNEPVVEFDTTHEIHAGFRETSLMRYTHPELVDKTFQKLPFVFSKKIMSLAVLFQSFKQIGISQGYVGSPSKADESYGKWFFDFTVTSYVNAAKAMIQHDDLPMLPADIQWKMKLLFWL